MKKGLRSGLRNPLVLLVAGAGFECAHSQNHTSDTVVTLPDISRQNSPQPPCEQEVASITEVGLTTCRDMAATSPEGIARPILGQRTICDQADHGQNYSPFPNPVIDSGTSNLDREPGATTNTAQPPHNSLLEYVSINPGNNFLITENTGAGGALSDLAALVLVWPTLPVSMRQQIVALALSHRREGGA